MNILDSIIGYLSPTAGARRLQARATMQQVQNLLGTGPKGPYAAASRNRLNMLGNALVKENEVSQDRLDNLRVESWNLYRDNSNARKIVRSLEAKVIGRGMVPESLATMPDGTPHVEFRKRAKQLWQAIQTGFDSRGMPGKGGLSMCSQQKLALRSVILSGNVLYRLKSIDSAQQSARDLPISATLQLIDSCRLADDSQIRDEIPTGNTVWRGIEFDSSGVRVAYWIVNVPLYAGANAPGDAVRVTVDEIGHLYIEEDIDQPIGVPWFAPAILRARNTGDLEYNVLMQSAAAACVVATYNKPTGSARLGLNSSQSDDSDLTDTDGNTISRLQPMMVINKGKDGSFDLQSPNQPNMNPEGFVQHLQRGIATAMPGIKSSTITGDYRNSSFSSERSADNDIWPELHDLQAWFAAGFCQPIWETVLRSAIFNGYFQGIVTAAEFQSEPGRFSAAKWQGPVAQSINPKDDVRAATDRIGSGLSSLQMECAKQNVNWRDVLNDVAEVYSVAAEKGIPQEVVNNIMSVDTKDQLASDTVAEDQQEEAVSAT